MAPLSQSFASLNYIRDQLRQRAQTSNHNPAAVTVRTIVRRQQTSLQAGQPIPNSTPLPTPTPVNPNWVPGQGIKHYNQVNNHAYFGLFAILGVAIVIASIWFFFWAKNGGFRWRKTDWDDYKSTVLRRKGPDGKTLSGATKTTYLGQKSVAGTFAIDRREEMSEKFEFDQQTRRNNEDRYTKRPRGHHNREPSDDDLRAYRHEKPARVGGINREPDGSHFDYLNTDRSDVSNNSRTHLVSKDRRQKKDKKGLKEKILGKKHVEKEKVSKSTSKPAREQYDIPPPVPAHSQSSVISSEDYMSEYQPPQPRYANDRTNSPRRSSPHRHSAGVPSRSARASRRPHSHSNQASVPGSWDATESISGSSDTGTKVYEHHIPALGSRPQQGFRRGRYDDSEL